LLAAICHLVEALICLWVWLATRSGPRSARQLVAIDALSGWANCGVFLVMGWLLPLWIRPELVMGTCCVHILALRAFMVPSSPRRTLLIGLVPTSAIVASAYLLYRDVPLHPEAPAASTMALLAAIVSASTLIVTTLTSRTIFGLRARVREAFQLGQYTLLEKIGEGGMGVVYRASHAMLRRPTAIKLLPPERAGAHNLARFEREVQLTSSLTHPNTVAIYDYGRSADGLLYYAMEYLDGLDLESLVELSGPQEPARVVFILTQICGALQEAHGVGLIHRDIKPGNILLCERGGASDIAKVVDFGLVKELASASPLSASSIDTMVGTPLYMSPEAILRPDKLDGRSDLYALAAVGYFLLTGRPPFSGGTILEICGHHLYTAPARPSEQLGRALPSELERVLLHCLEKEPAQRPASARELAEALLACRDVPTWSSEQARHWWDLQRPAIAALKQRTHDASMRASTLVGTVAIDLRARGLARTSPEHATD